MQIASTTLLREGQEAGLPPDKKHLRVLETIATQSFPDKKTTTLTASCALPQHKKDASFFQSILGVWKLDKAGKLEVSCQTPEGYGIVQ